MGWLIIIFSDSVEPVRAMSGRLTNTCYSSSWTAECEKNISLESIKS